MSPASWCIAVAPHTTQTHQHKTKKNRSKRKLRIYIHVQIFILSSPHTLIHIHENLHSGWPWKQNTKVELSLVSQVSNTRIQIYIQSCHKPFKWKQSWWLKSPQTTGDRFLVIFLTSVLLFLPIMHWPRSVGVIFQLLILIILLLDSGFRALLRWVLQSCSLIHSLLASVKWLPLQGWMEVLKGNEHSVTKHHCSTSKAFAGILTL